MGKKHKPLIVSEVFGQSAQSGRVGPVLTTFLHAPCSPSELANSKVDTDMSVSWKENSPNIQLSLSTPHLTYNSSKEPVTKYHNTYIAIRNKKTGKARLLEANNVVMVPAVAAPQTTNLLLLQEPDKEQTKEERLESGKHLMKSFGQAKGQRFYEQADRMKVEGSQVEEKVARAAGLVTEDKIETAAPPQQVEIIPPCNKAATTKENVYKLSDLLTVAEQNALADAAETLLNDYNTEDALKNGEKKRIFSPLGVKLLSKCLNDPGDIRQLSAITLYLETIIKFSRLRPGELKKGPRALQAFVPLGVKKKVFDMFSTGPANNKCLSPELQDKAVCYIIVLALLATNYKLDLSILTESIRTRTDKLRKLVTMVGASLVADSLTQQNSVVLRLPLASFNVNFFMKKKKK